MANTEQSRPVVAPVGAAPAADGGGEARPDAVEAVVAQRVTEEHAKWMRSLLPTMRWMLIGLTIFFFVASAAQLVYLHIDIVNAPTRDFAGVEAMMQKAQASSASADRQLPAAAIAALTTLEISAMERRYHQANVSLLTRTWTRYLGFMTGMVLAMVGATFILGRLETSPTTLKAEGGGWSGELISASPGMVLAVLGVGLMLTTIVTHHEIQIQDRPIYAQGWSLGAGGGENPAPPAPRPFDDGGQSQPTGSGGGDGMSDLLKKERDALRNGGAAQGSSVTR